MKKINTREIINSLMQEINKITQDRNKLILAILVILIIFYLVFLFGLQPQMRALAAINPRIARLRVDLNNLKADLSRLQRGTSDILADNIKKTISADQMSWLIEEISGMANKYEVKISQIKPVRSRAEMQQEHLYAGHSSIFIDMEISAGYHQLGRFLATLENHPVFLQIQRLDIKPNEKSPFTHNIDLRLEVYVSDKQ